MKEQEEVKDIQVKGEERVEEVEKEEQPWDVVEKEEGRPMMEKGEEESDVMEKAEDRKRKDKCLVEVGLMKRLREKLRTPLRNLRTPGMRLILLVMPVVWLLLSVFYIGIVLNANNFSR